MLDVKNQMPTHLGEWLEDFRSLLRFRVAGLVLFFGF